MFKLQPFILSLLENKLGHDLSSAHGASLLREDIESTTGEYLSLNTIKRLVGILPYKFNPRPIVLEIIARYLNFPSWVTLEVYANDHISEFGAQEVMIYLQNLPLKQKIVIEWEPDRKILISHLWDREYLVEESENSKLIKGDILKVSMAGKGIPFMVSSVVREGQDLGTFTAATQRGISGIRIL